MKEKEALDVLKELESTKKVVEELKQKLQKETSEVNLALEANNSTLVVDEADKENHGDNEANRPVESGNNHHCPSSAPGLILMELKQAKVNLSRTTTDLADIRSSVDSFNKKLEKERLALEKTRERLTHNSSQISSLEGELSETKLKLELAKEAEKRDGFDNPMEISKELHRLSSEVEQFKRVGEAARLEVQRATREIEQTKSRIRTAETRLIAATKMKEAARAAEAFALAEIKGMSDSSGVSKKERVTLSFEEYSSLVLKAREAEELSRERVSEAMRHVEEAEVSKTEILKKVDEAAEEVRTSKRVLEEALSRVEAANQGKLAVEEALRRWRSDRHSNNNAGQRRRSHGSSAKFKNQLHHRRDPRLIDVNGLSLVSDGSVPVLRPTLSIGQILSRKLLSPPEETEPRSSSGRSSGAARPKVSLGQMLRRHKGDHQRPSSSVKLEKESNSCGGGGGGRKQFSGKRKKFGFSRISLLLAKQSKKKKTSLNLR